MGCAASALSTDLWLVHQEKERETTGTVLAGVVPGPSLRDLQKMQYESSFQKLILNPERFNVWQENKRRIFFPNLSLNLCCEAPLGFLWAIKCVQPLYYIFTFTPRLPHNPLCPSATKYKGSLNHPCSQSHVLSHFLHHGLLQLGCKILSSKAGSWAL